MSVSRIDKIKPKHDVCITVSSSYVSQSLAIAFARLPPDELINELVEEFNRPGFLFGIGIAANGVFYAAVFGERDPLKYGACFPMHYESLDIAKVVEDICKEHGLTTEIK